MVLAAGVHPLHKNGAGFRQKNGIEMLGQRGFAAAVGAQHSHKFAAAHLHRYAVHRIAGQFRVIPEFDVLNVEHCIFQKRSLFYCSLSQTAVAPQGTVPPVEVTGRPISSHQVWPPAAGTSVVFKIYSITAGLRPSV